MPIIADLKRVNRIKRLHLAGSAGQAFSEFNRQYKQVLEKVFNEIRQETRFYLESNHQQTACRRGCVSCCSQYVTVNVAHALLVVGHLYADEKLLVRFLAKYSRWRTMFRGKPAAAILKQLDEYTTLSGAVRSYPQELCSAYHQLEIDCPFLDRGACSIHAVRPIVCAAYFSLSEAERCQPDSAVQPLILEIRPSRELLMEMDRLSHPHFHRHQESLPDLVYKLLTRGIFDLSRELDELFRNAR